MLLRINVHISFNGLQNSAFKGRSFPYVALCPSKRKKSEFRDISDVYDECIRLYEEAEKKGFNVGEAIYTQSFFFTDHELLIDSKMQNRIKEYRFCKSLSCPPYPSLSETPAEIVDDFFIIEEELNNCVKIKQKGDLNA